MTRTKDIARAERIARLDKEIAELVRRKESAAVVAPLLEARERLLQEALISVERPMTRSDLGDAFKVVYRGLGDIPPSRPSVYEREYARAQAAGKSGPSRYLIADPAVDPRSDTYREGLSQLERWGAGWTGIDFALSAVPAARDLEKNWRRGDRLVLFGEWYRMSDSFVNALARFVQERWTDLKRTDIQRWTVAPDLPSIALDTDPGPSILDINQRRPCAKCELPVFAHRYAPDNTRTFPAGTWLCLPEEAPDAKTWATIQRSNAADFSSLQAELDAMRYATWPTKANVEAEAAQRRVKEKRAKRREAEAPAVVTRTVRDYGNPDE